MEEAKLLIRGGRYVEASSVLEAFLAEHPEHVVGRYYLAVCRRKRNDLTGALAALDDLDAADSGYGRAYQERAYTLRALGRPAEARRAFERAVALNPALIASWRALAGGAGSPETAVEAKHHVAWLSSLPPELVTVASLIHENKLYKAEQICRDFLRRCPHHPEAMRLLAELGMKFQILDDAEFLLESCVEFAPEFLRARLDYVKVLHKRQKFHKALEQARSVHRSDPDNAGFQITLGNAQQAAGEYEAALDTYEEVLTAQPDHHGVHVSRGHTLKTIGRSEAAIEAYRAGYAAKPDYGDAFWSLANLKTYRFPDDELRHMRRYEAADGTSEVDRIHLCFAIGKALEDRGEFAASFEYYERGNALKRREGTYDPARIDAELDFQMQHFGAGFFAPRTGSGCPAPDPIFIVGLPRAGSTLLEQILASHSRIDGTMELANIIGLAHRLNGRRLVRETPRYPGILADLGTEDLARLGEAYIADTRSHRRGAPFFVDKMPNNFRHIALIQLILPNARIIDARRHPLACCFSGYKQLFAEGQEFTYGLERVGHYYRKYVEIMAHWDAVLPGRILRVQHEDVVADVETQVRRILDYCGLPFESACVDFHHTRRAIRTPSSEQVRQPIYQTGLEQWRHYESFLEPLKAALGPALAPASPHP